MIVHHYVDLLRQHLFAVILIVLGLSLASAAASLFVLVTDPKYTATATVTMLPSEAELSFTKGWLGRNQQNPATVSTETHLEYLQSRPVLKLALSRMHGDAATESSDSDSPEPDAYGLIRKLGRSIGELDAVETVVSFRELVGMAAEYLNYGAIRRTPEEEREVRQLRRAIEVTPMQSSYILLIRVNLPDPVEAAAAANALAEAYQARSAGELNSSISVMKEQLENEVADRERTLVHLNAEHLKLAQSHGIQSSEVELAALMTSRFAERGRLNEENVQLAEANVRIEALREALERLQNHPGGMLDGGIELQAKLREQIMLSEATRAALARGQKARQQVIQSLDSDVQSYTRNRQKFLPLQRRIESVSNDLDDLRQRLLTVNLASSEGGGQVRLIERAVPPTHPSSPKVLTNTLLAGVAGMLLAGLMLVGIDSFSGAIKTQFDLWRMFGERTLGSVSRRMLKKATANRLSGDKRLLQMGRNVITHFTLLGVDSYKVHVSGFADEQDVADFTAILAAALTAAGTPAMASAADPETGTRRSSAIGARMLPVLAKTSQEIVGPEEHPSSDALAAYDEGEALPDNRVELVSLGPIGSTFRWSRLETLICVVAAGRVSDATLVELSKAVESRGAQILFILLTD